MGKLTFILVSTGLHYITYMYGILHHMMEKYINIETIVLLK